MKIKRGGGGIDKDGNNYKLPEDEVEVPDDYFERVMAAFSTAPAPQESIKARPGVGRAEETC